MALMPVVGQRVNGNGKTSTAIPPSSPVGKKPLTTAQVLQFRSLIDSIVNSRLDFAAKAGLTFRGLRDLDRSLGRLEKITSSNYRHRALRGGIASLLITKLPKDAWAIDPEIRQVIDGELPIDLTPWDVEVSKLFKKLDACYVLREADIYCRRGRYSIIAMTLPESYGPASTAISRTVRADDIISLMPYDEVSSLVTRTIKDTSSPLLGWPEQYSLVLNDNSSVKIHHSRVIHLSDSPTPWGRPSLEKSWDDLDDLNKVVGGASETAFQTKGTLWTDRDRTEIYESDEQATIDSDLEAYDFPRDTIEDMITAFRHDANGDLIVPGMDAKQLGGTVPRVEGLAKLLIRLISGTQEYPERLLLGTEESKLAGDQDSVEYNEKTVTAHRNGPATRHIRRLVDRLIQLGAVSNIDDYGINWTEPSRSNKALGQVASLFAAANRNQHTATGETIYDIDEIRSMTNHGPREINNEIDNDIDDSEVDNEIDNEIDDNVEGE